MSGPGGRNSPTGASAEPTVPPATPTGLERWEDAVGERVHEDFLQTVVLADPRYAAAHRLAIESALAYSQGHAAFQAAMSDSGQLFLCGIALYMDVSGGLTHRRLRALMGDAGILSAGRATALLWRLRMGKFIEPLDGDTGEGLLKRFVPTKAMEDAFRERFRIDLDAIAATFEPGVAPILERMNEPAVFGGLIRRMGDDLMGAAAREDPLLKAYNLIAARTAGVLVMYALVMSVEVDDGRFPSCGVTTASVAGLAKRFKTSRSHMLSLLRQMEKLGFITFDPASGRPVIQPPMRDAMRRCEALVFIGEIRAVHRVMVQLRRETAA